MSIVDPVPHEPFSVSALPDRDEVTVLPAGELDIATAAILDTEVRELRSRGFERIVVDLRRLTFIDSAGLRLLLTLRNDAKRNEHGFVLVPGPPVVQRVFDITRTRTLFDWRRV